MKKNINLRRALCCAAAAAVIAASTPQTVFGMHTVIRATNEFTGTYTPAQMQDIAAYIVQRLGTPQR